MWTVIDQDFAAFAAMPSIFHGYGWFGRLRPWHEASFPLLRCLPLKGVLRKIVSHPKGSVQCPFKGVHAEMLIDSCKLRFFDVLL